MNKYEPAFPVIISPGDGVKTYGLTKREIFAMAAMNGMLCRTEGGSIPISVADLMVKNSVALADALLAELGKKE